MRAVAVVLLALAPALPSQVGTASPDAGQVAREPLIGTVVDPAGKPVAAAMVEIWRADGQDMRGLDLDYNRTFRLIGRVPTNKAGDFGLHIARGLRYQLRVDKAPFARVIRDTVDAGESIRVELPPPATLAGRVALPDGTGIPSSIRAWNSEHTCVVDGRTDAAGGFRFDRLPPGGLTLDVTPDNASGPAWLNLTLLCGETVEQSITCQPGFILRGRVLDATSGKPIAGARVGEGWVLRGAVITGEDGSYALPGCGSDGYKDVQCTADGYVRVVQPTKDIPVAEPRMFDFRLDRGNTAAGSVADPSGAPIGNAYVAAVGMVHDGMNHYHYWVSGRTDVDGSFRLSGIRPDIPPTLLVRKDGWATLVLHLPTAKNGVHDAGKVDLRRPRLVTGVVIGPDGKPAALTPVSLWGTNADRSRLASMPATLGRIGGWQLLERYVALRSARTDDKGHFAFGDIAAGDYKLVVSGPNNAPLLTRDGIVVRPHNDPEQLLLDLSKPGEPQPASAGGGR
jgi:protocatechuate 3,4-dioxygenase beta subunit